MLRLDNGAMRPVEVAGMDSMWFRALLKCKRALRLVDMQYIILPTEGQLLSGRFVESRPWHGDHIDRRFVPH